eukprot:scaffold184_cov125-Cylindrotheca_fusiformis.AAC.12
MTRGRGSSLLLSLLLLLQLAEGRELQQCESCFAPIEFIPDLFKPTYTIGVLSYEGPQAAYGAYEKTFRDYLTATAGRRFDPPLSFEMIELDFQSMYELTEEKEVDYLFVSPSGAACLEAQYKTQSLASILNRSTKGGTPRDFPEFAGAIIVEASNDNINVVEDLKDKIVAATSISGFGSGLSQFYEMQKRGMMYLNDPSAVIFTNNQAQVVLGVLNGTFDVGFARADVIDDILEESGDINDLSRIKVLEDRSDLTDAGTYPYPHTTPMYPEWNIAALKQTPSEISREVQAALLALTDHARTGQALEECVVADTTNSSCSDLKSLDPLARCDTTDEIAMLALQALRDGDYGGWRTTKSYSEIRGILQIAGFIKQEPVDGVWKCLPPSDLYEQIVCPDNFYKLPLDSYNEACVGIGLGFECPDSYDCVCKPCFEATAVEVAVEGKYKRGEGCPKMSVCGEVEQNEVITFTVADNTRAGLNLTVVVLEGNNKREVPIKAGSAADLYSFSVSSSRVGSMILQIFDGENEVAVSPLRVRVNSRTCDPGRRPDEMGKCICAGIFIPLVALGSVALYWYVKGKNHAANSLFLVKPSELQFSDPPNIIGRGSFGFVLQAEYRGSKVAVKRVIPPKKTKKTQLDGTRFGYNVRAVSSSLSPNNSTESTQRSDVETGRRNSSESRSRQERSAKKSLSGSFNVTIQSGGIEKAPMESDIDDEEDISVDLSSDPQLNLKAEEEFSSVSSAGDNEISLSTRSVERLQAGFPNLMASTESRIIDLNEDGLVKKKRGSTEKAKTVSQMKLEFIEEMRVLSKLRHPNITTVMGAVIDKGSDPMLIMEFMEHGSLQEVLLNPTMVIESDLILHILKDIAQGVRFLHSSDPPLIHGDLKSGNVLIDSKFRAKLSDFGLSKRKPDKATGTPLWMAPELLLGQSMNTPKSDMYSVGIIMYEIFSRKEPYNEATESNAELLRAIVDRKKSKRPRIPPYCPMKVKKLIKFLWHADPALRPTARELDNRLQEMDAKVFDSCTLAAMGHRLDKPEEGDHEHFLYQAFPRHVADVLKAGGKVKPEPHDNVTIFFSDIVGFTTIASRLEPWKVSHLLDRLYMKFDKLSQRHDLFKIETIGDAYMCAGNLAKDQSGDHVKRVALFALDAIKVASETLIDEENPSDGCVLIRVGFHSGPVVSNVVGSLNPRYGIFGDTVNVASRMESNSEEGRIHCSKASAKQLMNQAPEIPLKLRGETHIKGKGKMVTYWVG